MPRKPKDVYTRIREKEAQIEKLKLKLETYHDELSILNKERDELEMRQIFDSARENNLSIREVLNLINRNGKKENS